MLKSNSESMITIKKDNEDRHYFTSYADTTKFLSEQIIKELEEITPNLQYVIPTVFLMRHTIEIALKILIKDIDSKNMIANSSHSLKDLYEECEKLNLNVKAYPRLKEFVGDLDFIDSNSYRFRYSTNKDGNNIRTSDDQINIEYYIERFNESLDEIVNIMK